MVKISEGSYQGDEKAPNRTMVMVAQVVKISKNHLKWMQHIIWKIYLNRSIFIENIKKLKKEKHVCQNTDSLVLLQSPCDSIQFVDFQLRNIDINRKNPTPTPTQSSVQPHYFFSSLTCSGEFPGQCIQLYTRLIAR